MDAAKAEIPTANSVCPTLSNAIMALATFLTSATVVKHNDGHKTRKYAATAKKFQLLQHFYV